MSSDALPSSLRLTNYRMAFGRIGLAAVFVPMLVALAVLYGSDEHGSIVVALLLALACLPFLWFALTVPISVALGETLRVRYLFGRQEVPRKNVSGVRFGAIKSRLGVKALTRSNNIRSRSYQCAVIQTDRGSKITFLVNNQQAQALQSQLRVLR